MLSASFSGTVRGSSPGVWTRRQGVGRQDGCQVLTLKGHTAAYSVSFKPTVRGSSPGVWTRREGVGRQDGCRALTTGHTDVVFSASFSADGSRIVTGSSDNTAKVGTPRRCRVLTLTGHRHRNSVSFSADGSRIVTGSFDGTAKVWTPRRCRGAHTQGHHGQVRSASFSGDDSRIVTGSSENTAKGGTPRRVPRCRTHGAHGRRVFGVVQWGRFTDRHRECGPDGEGVDAKTGVRCSPQGHTGSVSSVSFSGTVRGSPPGLGQHGEGVGRAKTVPSAHTQGAHGRRLVRVVQWGQFADRHRELGQDGRCGTRPVNRESLPRSLARRSGKVDPFESGGRACPLSRPCRWPFRFHLRVAHAGIGWYISRRR